MTEYVCELTDADLAAWDPDVRDEVVRCRDCQESRRDGTLCVLFASWEPISGGDEFVSVPADVEPDGFCAWGRRRATLADLYGVWRGAE